MNLELESLRRFVREEILPGVRERDLSEEFPLGLFEKLHALGYLNPFVPAELGGMGAGTGTMNSIAREIAYASPGMTCAMAGNMLSLVPVLLNGSEALRRRVARAVLEKLELGAFCFTEPEAGSDILRIKTQARRAPGGYLLKGSKCFITNASYAGHYVVMAKLAGVENPKAAMTAFYVPAGARGLSTGKPLSKLGQRESNTAEVYFDDVFVPEADRIGGEGRGLDVAVQSLERSRTFFAASAIGLCDRARDLVREFLAGREHYGKPLLEQPQIRGTLAQLEAEARAAWLLTCDSGEAWDAGDYRLQHSSMAKMIAGQIAVKYAGAALELFGGWGFTREFEIERLYRDAKLYEIIEGPTFVQQTIIAKELFPVERREGAAGSRRKAA